jgi:hypothetical protein
MTVEKRDKLNEAILLCAIHSDRMNFAWGKIKMYFPLDREKYIRLEPEKLSFIDQLIFRFSKMQDTMGERLFPAIFENLGENVRGLPFIDQLAKLEELNIIPNAIEWMQLRETRNIVTHEYPFVTDEIIQGLNLLSEHYLLITNIWKQTESYIKTRFKSEK